MISVRFGLSCDTANTSLDVSCVGKITLGTMGLLNLLETQLGLPNCDVSSVTRLILYHECIQSVLNDEFFFSKSFAADEFATTRVLLEWRDELYHCGWKGNFEKPVPKRLQDMARIEELAKETVPLNIGQRIQSVLKRLEEQGTQISAIELLDKFERFPVLWQKIIIRLADQGGYEVKKFDFKPASCSIQSDLYKVQQYLSTYFNDKPSPKPTLNGDGSIALFTASSTELSAKALSHGIKTSSPGSKQRHSTYGFIAEKDGAVMDNAFHKVGLPRLGFESV